MRIDAHHHFWQLGRFDYNFLSPEQKVLWRDFLPNDLAPLLHAAGIDRSVLVQTIASVDETKWFLELAGQHEFLAGVVGWVDLTDGRLEHVLDEIAQHPKLVGIRHNVHDEKDHAWLSRTEVRRGLAVLAARGLPFDLLIRPRHLAECVKLVTELPQLHVVVDHLAKPRIADRGWEDWATGMAQLARFPQVYCKLSGMITEAKHALWQAADLAPYVEHVLHCFGPQRSMFGSDWPVCLLAGDYARMRDALRVIVQHLGGAELAAIWGETAAQFYRLSSV